MGIAGEPIRLSRHGSRFTASLPKVRVFAIILLAAVALAGALRMDGRSRTQSGSSLSNGLKLAPSQGQALSMLGRLPLMFEANQGQSDPQVKFMARGLGYGLFLTPQEAVLSLSHRRVDASKNSKEKNSRETMRFSAIRMQMQGANPNSVITGADRLPGKSNYIIGNDPAKWHRNIPQFARVRYQGVYPGIDLTYYGSRGHLEYDFEVAPGADPRQILLRFAGADQLHLNANGNLAIAADGGEIELQAPTIYQQAGDRRSIVPGHYVLHDDQVGFEIAGYDRNRALVIDPSLSYASYLGGSGDEACSILKPSTWDNNPPGPVPGCPSIIVNPSNVYVAGSTSSTDFPAALSNTGTSLTGKANIFVIEFDAAATTVQFATYFGGTHTSGGAAGTSTDLLAGLAIDSNAPPFIYLAGSTDASDFPTTSSAYQAPPVSAGPHVFVTKLNAQTNQLQYSSYLAGNGHDLASGLAVDTSNQMYVTGTTTSTTGACSGGVPAVGNFPATLGSFQPCPGAGSTSQAFFSQISTDTTNKPGPASLLYSTFIGGTAAGNPLGLGMIGGGIALDNNSRGTNAYITGGTPFTDMPILDAFQATLAGSKYDAWVAKINPSALPGAQLKYLSYLGSTAKNDVGYGIAVDNASNAYVTGSVGGTIFPTITQPTAAFQSSFQGGASDAFLAELGPNPIGICPGASQVCSIPLIYFSYVGGTGDDVGYSISSDGSAQGAYIAGSTTASTTGEPALLADSGSKAAGTNAFVAHINTAATSPTLGNYFDYLGGSGSDIATSIFFNGNLGFPYFAGETTSTDFLVGVNTGNSAYQGALQATPPAISDAFFARLGSSVSLTVTGAPGGGTDVVGVGNTASFKYTVTNTGSDPAFGVTLTVALPTSGATFSSAIASPGTCGGAGNLQVSCSIGELTPGSSAVVTVTVSTFETGNDTQITSSAQATANGGAISNNVTVPILVNGFTATSAGSPVTVQAGTDAFFTVTVAPTRMMDFPNSVTLSCSSGLPAGLGAGNCQFSSPMISNLDNGPFTTDLTITTIRRTTVVVQDWRHGLKPLYATWFPISGLAFLGVGIGGGFSRKKKILLSLLLGGVLSLMLSQAACGGSSSTTTTTGTAAGTYNIVVTARSGTETRNTVVTLIVE